MARWIQQLQFFTGDSEEKRKGATPKTFPQELRAFPEVPSEPDINPPSKAICFK
jgi:hypothetical protein